MNGLTINELSRTSDVSGVDLLEVDRSGTPHSIAASDLISGGALNAAKTQGFEGSKEELVKKWATSITSEDVSSEVKPDNTLPVSSEAVTKAITQAKTEVTEQGEKFVRIYAQPKYKGTAQTDLYVARGAVYNADTGLYELNGLTDITEDQMREIYLYTASRIYDFNMSYTFSALYIRTNFPVNKRYMANR